MSVLVELLAAVPGNHQFLCDATAVRHAVRKPFFFNFARETDRSHCILHEMEAQAMLSGVVLLFFWLSGEVQMCT